MDDAERAVIVVGAGEDRSRFANKAVRAHLEAGFRVYPVHPTAESSEGIPASKSIAEVPGQAALLLLYVRPATGLEVIDQAPAKGVRRVLLNPGSESPELIARIEALGMEAVSACSIVALGRRPSEFPS